MGILTTGSGYIYAPAHAAVVAVDYANHKIVLAPYKSAFSKFTITIWNIRVKKITRGVDVKGPRKTGAIKTCVGAVVLNPAAHLQ